MGKDDLTSSGGADGRSGAEHRFTPTTLLILGGLLIWTADFGFVYVFAAVACARRFADLQIAGLHVVPLVTTTATLLAAIVTAALIRYASKRAQSQADEHSRFIYFIAFAAAGVALVAMLWLLLPPLVMHACVGEGNGSR